MSTAGDFIKIAVLSDLHAYVDAAVGSEPSFMRVTDEEEAATESPVNGLLDLIRRENLRADLVLCPGDIGDKAVPRGIAHAWQRLHKIREALGANSYVASTGNHDMDSRALYNQYDPTDALKRLSPAYPVADQVQMFRYWSDYFCVVESDSYRVISLNSSAFHWMAAEINRGRVSRRTLELLREELPRLSSKPLNIVLCHHHPHLNAELSRLDASYQVMQDGDRLIDVLGGDQTTQWLIVHGHKHFPHVAYAAGRGQSPVVFSCGSFSARLYPELQTRARNQFYVVEIPLHSVAMLGLVGRIRAWDWSFGLGWIKPTSGSGLSSLTPFGAREAPTALATRLANVVGSAPFVTWSELISHVPTLEFVLPDDLQTVERILNNKHGLSVNWHDGSPTQLGRTANG